MNIFITKLILVPDPNNKENLIDNIIEYKDNNCGMDEIYKNRVKLL